MPIRRGVCISYLLLAKQKKEAMSNIPALLSEVTRRWNIPGKRKQKKKKVLKVEKIHITAVSQHGQLWDKAESFSWPQPAPRVSQGWDSALSPRLDLCAHRTSANPLGHGAAAEEPRRQAATVPEPLVAPPASWCCSCLLPRAPEHPTDPAAHPRHVLTAHRNPASCRFL